MIFQNIKFQIRLLLSRKSIYLSFVIFLAFNIYCFIEMALEYRGKDIYYIVSADMAFSLSSRNFGFIIIAVAAIISAIPFSDSYITDKKTNVLPAIFIKSNRKLYYYSKLLAVFVGTFFVILIPLIINQVLCLSYFPFVSDIKHYTMSPTLSVNYFNDLTDYGFSNLYLFHRYLFNITYAIVFSFFWALISCLSYAFSLFYTSQKIVILSIPFLIYIIQQALEITVDARIPMSSGHYYFISLSNFILPETYGLTYNLFFFLIELAVIFAIIIKLLSFRASNTEV